MNRYGKLHAILAGLLLAGPALHAQSVCRQAPPDRVARLQVDSALVHYDSLIRRTLGDSIAAMYTADGEMLGDNMAPVHGPAAIARLLSQFSGFRVDTEQMRSEALAIADTEATQWGTWRQAATPPGQPMVHVQGRFVAQWIRGCDGNWRLRRLLTQSTPP